MRYGQRVTVIALPAPAILTSERGLKKVGPRAFGYDLEDDRRDLRRIGGDFASELLVGGQRVLPNKALSHGFVFRHETLRSAFEAIL